MTALSPAAPETTTERRILAAPYLIAYDICDKGRYRKVYRCLRRWRIDGQYSVHETWLTGGELADVLTELTSLINTNADRVLVVRLGVRKRRPLVWTLFPNPRPSRFAIGHAHGSPPEHNPREQPYVLAYDVRDERRLQRAQRRTAKICTFLQRSVYLYQGPYGTMTELLDDLSSILDPDADDVRVYPVRNLRALWLIAGASQHLVNLPTHRWEVSWWKRLFGT